MPEAWSWKRPNKNNWGKYATILTVYKHKPTASNTLGTVVMTVLSLQLKYCCLFLSGSQESDCWWGGSYCAKHLPHTKFCTNLNALLAENMSHKANYPISTNNYLNISVDLEASKVTPLHFKKLKCVTDCVITDTCWNRPRTWATMSLCPMAQLEILTFCFSWSPYNDIPVANRSEDWPIWI